ILTRRLRSERYGRTSCGRSPCGAGPSALARRVVGASGHVRRGGTYIGCGSVDASVGGDTDRSETSPLSGAVLGLDDDRVSAGGTIGWLRPLLIGAGLASACTETETEAEPPAPADAVVEPADGVE